MPEPTIPIKDVISRLDELIELIPQGWSHIFDYREELDAKREAGGHDAE